LEHLPHAMHASIFIPANETISASTPCSSTTFAHSCIINAVFPLGFGLPLINSTFMIAFLLWYVLCHATQIAFGQNCPWEFGV
jgi:hypothetical protein